MKRKKELPHGAKLVRNLILLLLLGVLVWGLTGFSAPTVRDRFRMAEGANWAGPSDVQGVVDTRYDRWVVASCQDQLIVWRDGGTDLEYWPRAEEGTTLAPVPERRVDMGEVWVAAADVPEGTASAQLELTVRCWYRRNADGWTIDSQPEQPDGVSLTERWEKTYSAQGECLEDGAVLFHVAPEGENWENRTMEELILSHAYEWDLYWAEQNRRAVDCRMEAVFYDRAGQELGRAQLATTEQGGAPWTGN